MRYGRAGVRGLIPPNANLVFEAVRLCSLNMHCAHSESPVAEPSKVELLEVGNPKDSSVDAARSKRTSEIQIAVRMPWIMHCPVHATQAHAHFISSLFFSVVSC